MLTFKMEIADPIHVRIANTAVIIYLMKAFFVILLKRVKEFS